MWVIRSNRVGLFVACLLGVAGCTKYERDAFDRLTSSPGPSTPQEVVAAEGCRLDVTEDEARAYFGRLKTAVDGRQHETLLSLIDYNILGKVGVRGGKDRRSAEQFVEGFREGAGRNPGGMFHQILEQNSRLRLLRITVNPRGRQVLVRIVGDKGLNYLEVDLARRSSGEVIAYDVFNYSIGEHFSDIMRRVYILSGGDPETLRFDSSPSPESKQAQALMTNMVDALRGKRYQDVIAGFARLPESFRKERVLLAMRMQAAAELGDDAYRAALADIRKYHGEADWTSMLLLDDDYLRRDFDGAHRRLDRLDRSVGGDPYLDFMRANLDIERERFDTAYIFAKRATEAEPEMFVGHNALLTSAVALRKFDVVVRELVILEQSHDVDVDALVETDAYHEFVESPEYKRWKIARARDE